MGTRQRKRLLRRRQAASARRTGRRTAVVSGTAFTGAAGLVASLAVVPVASASDGSAPEASGPVTLVADLNPGAAGSNPSRPVAWGDGVLFTAVAVDGERRLWHADAEGAERVFDSPPFDETTLGTTMTRPAYVVGDKLYFTAEEFDEPDGQKLWVSDGTTAGTEELAAADTDGYYDNLEILADVGGSLFFAELGQSDGDGGRRSLLWATDGTVDGTRPVAELPASDTYARVSAVAGDQLFFKSWGYEEYGSLWVTDGTETGTRLLVDNSGYDGGARNETAVGDDVFFSSNVDDKGEELWITDGTGAGTERVADLEPGRRGSYPASFMDLGGTLVFQTLEPKPKLWRSGGTRATTTLIRKLPGNTRTLVRDSAVLGAWGIFSVQQGKRTQLWRTDGSRSGTVQLTAFVKRDVRKSEGGVVRESFAVADGRVWFVASTGSRGRELWSTDGTRNGTGPISDLSPGLRGSNPRGLTAAGGLVWFTSDDGSHGREPWRTRADVAVEGAVVTAPIKQAQPPGKVRVKVKVGADETVSVKVRALVKIKGSKRSLKITKRVQTWPGTTHTVKLKKPRKSLKLARKASVRVVFRDLAGHKVKRDLTVKIG